TRAINMKAYDTDDDQVMEELVFNSSFSTDFMVLVYIIAGGYVESGIEGGADTVAPGGGGGETPEGIVAEITEDIFANVTLDCPEGYVWDEFGDYGEPNQCNLYISPLATLEGQLLGISPMLILLVIIVLWFIIDKQSRDKALKYGNGIIPR
ncbi:MAG: hypothetical protein KAJ24_01135, partial [Candidatus Aenigmarchaeota archaeon]|nr:hypothetical protein [Candidatus Aenigmarchaeota archaeon]